MQTSVFGINYLELEAKVAVADLGFERWSLIQAFLALAKLVFTLASKDFTNKLWH